MYNITPIRKNNVIKRVIFKIFSFIKYPRNKELRRMYNHALKVHTKRSLPLNLYYNICIDKLRNIPIFIISYNRLLYLKNIICCLEKYHLTNIHIVDNNSDYIPLLNYYKTCPYTIHKMDKNYGHRVVWTCGLFDNIINNSIYIVSDPDIDFNKKLPNEFIKTLFCYLYQYPFVTKVGFALDIQNLPNNTNKEYIIKNEKLYWKFRGDPKTILGNTSGSVCYTTAPCQVGVVSQMS